jgi:Tfp pilus assembly protein PilO
MKINTKNITKILAVILLVTISAVVYLKLSLNKDIKYIIETKQNNFLASEKINSIFGLKSKIEATKKISDSFDILYIDRNNILSFIETVEKMAEKNKTVLTIDSVNIDESHLKDPLPYGLLNMNLTIKGNYANILSFISALEKMPYFITINNVRLVKAGGDNETEWSANLSLSGITN